jgi:hypothetical protein
MGEFILPSNHYLTNSLLDHLLNIRQLQTSKVI